MKLYRKEVKDVVTEIMYDYMSNMCYSEVTDSIIEDVVNAVIEKNSIFGVLNDNLSNCAVDELERVGAIEELLKLSNQLVLQENKINIVCP